ncbi:MAG: BatA domain-containing protein [Verrucomicrobiales bacterium]
MNFLSPAFLIGLPLVAVPLVIHLLSRRQQKRISWGAMRFLVQAVTRRRRIWRLTDLLLLLLRTCAFLFFIFALARPMLEATWLGRSIPREIILVIDQSLSMSRKVDGASLFDLQLQKANAVLDKLTNTDSVRVLLAGETPEWLTPDALEPNSQSLRKLREDLSKLKPTLGAADLMAAVREAADLEAPPEKAGRSIIVISDGQRFGWRMDERGLWAAVQSRLQKATLPTQVALHFLGRESSPGGNLSVNRIESPRGLGTINQPMNFTAQVQNHGSQPSRATLLTWKADEQSLGAITVPELAPGAITSVSIAHQFAATGVADVVGQLETNDALAGDNEGHWLVETFDHLPVLLVEDAASGHALEKDSGFVLAALGKQKTSAANEGAWRSVFEPTVIDPGALAATDLDRFRAVILANLRDVAPAALDKLQSYVQSGGGLWMALGAQTDDTFFNDSLYRDGAGLAPLKLGSPVGDADDHEKFFALRVSSGSHPATALLADFQRLDLDRARIYRRHQFDAFSGKDVSVLLQVQQGDPVVVERKLERGRVLVQGIPLGISWSTLPLCQAYVALLHEWLWYLAQPSLPKRNLTAGEPILERIESRGVTADLVRPDQVTVELPPEARSLGTQFIYAGTRLPGKYTMNLKAKDSSARADFYVQRNPQESDLKGLSEQDLQQIGAMKEFQIGAEMETLAAAAKAEIPKHPIEGSLLIALACALLGEVLLAGWVTRRRNLRLAPVTMEA